MKISALPFFGTLSNAGRAALEQNLKSVSCSKGQIVRESGDLLYGMIFVEEGVLSVSLLSEEGREVTLFRLRKGTACFLSDGQTIPGISFDVTIEAETDAKIHVLSSSCLSLLMNGNSTFSEYVYKTLMENFSDTVKILQSVLFYSFEQRLASFLLEEMSVCQSNRLVITHERIARHIGSAREVVSRMLKRFSDQGIVALERGCVVILNKDRLKKFLS